MFVQKENYLFHLFTFSDFTAAFSFMTGVAILAEKQNHHPNWSNVYNRVEIRLNTHDAGDVVTEKDHQLAKSIEAFYNANFSKA